MGVDGAWLQGVDEILKGRQLLVVSNREPYAHHRGPHGLTVSRPAGGLVAALDPVMQVTSGTWIAWGSGDADFDVTDGEGRVLVPSDAPQYTLKRIALSRPEIDGYYHGYANQVLWPLCHLSLERMRVRARSWATYEDVNRRFAGAVKAEAAHGALVWLHDYHLACCPREIRRMRPDLFLMHFWHVPWPAWDVFRVCPQRAELLDGLLGNDLVTFQHSRHAAHFLECARREVGARVEDGVVEYDGRRIHVAALPISVDVSTLDQMARSGSCEQWMAGLRRLFGLEGRAVVVSVDRLDYTKGIPERLRAIERLLRRRPEYQSRVVFVQKVATSRMQVEAYRALRGRIEERVARLNKSYGTSDWQPVVYLPAPLPPAGMAALYRMADVCIVSSLQDGMNLVAKEFVACQVDARGVLLLSELAGAHDELAGAVSINPYDTESCTDAIVHALEMPPEERSRRMDHLRTHLIGHDVYHWMGKHLETAGRLLAEGTPALTASDAIDVVAAAVSRGRSLALFLDFDGTLARFTEHPDRVELPEEIRATLARLAERPQTLVALVSGRAISDLRARVGLDRISYAGNHGLEISGPGCSWIHPEAERARAAIETCYRQLCRRFQELPGAWVQDKGLSLTVHYRQTPGPFIERVRAAVFEESARGPAERVVVHQGKQALELRPDISWHKGAAVRWMLTQTFGEAWPAAACVVYIGDDWTDEDAFLTLPDPAVTVQVGRIPDQTAAKYRVHDVDEVHRLLRALDNRLSAAQRPAEAVPLHA